MAVTNTNTNTSSWSRDYLSKIADCQIDEIVHLAGHYNHIDTSDSLITIPNLRRVLDRIDFVLKIGGTIRVKCTDFSDTPKMGKRTGTQIQYEIACIFPDSYTLVNRSDGDLIFRKNCDGRHYNAGPISVSLGYITDGRDLNMIRRTLSELCRVSDVNINEVFLAGPIEAARTLSDLYPRLVHVGDYRHDDLRAPINRKKQLIIDAAKEDNLILAHDRFYLDNLFWERLAQHGNRFDFYNCRHCLVSDSSDEIEVFGAYGMHRWPISAFSYNYRSSASPRSGSNPHYYNSGGIYIGKLLWFRNGRWPQHLHWGDLEDVHFTRRCELDGAIWRHDWSNRVLTTNKRLSLIKKPRFDQLVRKILKNGLNACRFWRNYRELEVR